MAFTQLELNYAIEYSKAMANAYPYWSYFSDLYGSPNSATYKPVSGKAVVSTPPNPVAAVANVEAA